MHSFWIALGAVNPRDSQAETRGSMRPSEANVAGASGSAWGSVVRATALEGREEEVEAAGAGEGEREPFEPASEPEDDPECSSASWSALDEAWDDMDGMECGVGDFFSRPPSCRSIRRI